MQTCSITKKTAAATPISRPSALLFSCGGLKAVKSERDSNRWATVSRQNRCSHNVQLRCGGKLQLRSTSEHPFHFSFVSFSPHPPTLPLSPTCSTRLTFYLTAAALVCVAVDGDEVGFNKKKKKSGERMMVAQRQGESDRLLRLRYCFFGGFFNRSTSMCSSASCYSGTRL